MTSYDLAATSAVFRQLHCRPHRVLRVSAAVYVVLCPAVVCRGGHLRGKRGNVVVFETGRGKCVPDCDVLLCSNLTAVQYVA